MGVRDVPSLDFSDMLTVLGRSKFGLGLDGERITHISPRQKSLTSRAYRIRSLSGLLALIGSLRKFDIQDDEPTEALCVAYGAYLSGRLLNNGVSVARFFGENWGALAFAARWFDLTPEAMVDVAGASWWHVGRELARRPDLALEAQFALLDREVDKNNARLWKEMAILPTISDEVKVLAALKASEYA